VAAVAVADGAAEAGRARTATATVATRAAEHSPTPYAARASTRACPGTADRGL
jgi:hypothetical protein